MFIFIFLGILLVLTFFCWWLPHRAGEKQTGKNAALILGLIILATVVSNPEFFAVFLWVFMFIFQVIWIIHWALKGSGRKKLARIISAILVGVFFIACLSPWIEDLIFTKKDALKLLSAQGIILQDKSTLISNEASGLMDYVQEFTLKLTQADFDRIANDIRNAPNFKVFSDDSLQSIPYPERMKLDTANYETDHFINREYFTKEKQPDGTYHFIFQLDKSRLELKYLGINE